MTRSEARRLVQSLRTRMNLPDSEAVIHEALRFFDWAIREQEKGNSIFMEQEGCLEEILLLYERSKKEVADVG